ncbi:MAG: hydrogenase maturation protease [Candidatus Saccharicenans sp.]|uniref:hydrogenase maturation protease n=1 Tax=Candidatus Saccharicenans sp. TaxID=2819258 RepID=UPI004049B53B
MPQTKILVYGIGNPGRQDDGLGPALVARLENKKITGLRLEADYQLQIEDALLFLGQDLVIVVDALKTGHKPFIFRRIKPAGDFTFTSHSLPPATVAFLCQQLYEKTPEVYILGIRGYEFEPGEKLSLKARDNLRQALAFILGILKQPHSLLKSSAIMAKKAESKITSGRRKNGKSKKRSSGS